MNDSARSRNRYCLLIQAPEKPYSKGTLFTHASDLCRRITGHFDRGIWVITLVDLINAAGFSTCVPFLALYLYQERGIPMTLVGTVFLVSGLISSVTQMAGGMLSDRFGRRSLILISMSINILTNLGMAVMIAFDVSVPVMLTVYVLGRAAGMTARPAISAMVVDLSGKQNLTETYGLLRVGRNLGWAAGPALGGYLAAFLPYSWLFGTAVIMNMIAISIILFFLKESWEGKVERMEFRSLFTAAADRTFVLFTVLCMLVFLSMAHFGTTLSVFTVDRSGFSTSEYGLLLTTNGLFVVLFQYPVAMGISKLKKYHALIIGGLFYGIGYLFMSTVTSFSGAVPAMIIITMGEIVFSPVATAVVGELAPLEQRGRYMGFFGWSETLGMSLAPLVGGILLDTFITNPGMVWLPIAGFSFAAGIGFFWWGKITGNKVYHSTEQS
jgi:MFS family permease